MANLGLRVLLEPIVVALLLRDFTFFELRPGGIGHHGALRLQLGLIGLQGLGAVAGLGLLVGRGFLHASRGGLAVGGVLGDRLKVHEPDLGADRERRGRRQRGRGCLSGAPARRQAACGGRLRPRAPGPQPRA